METANKKILLVEDDQDKKITKTSGSFSKLVTSTGPSESKKIFEKYNNDVPRISDQKINDGLKELGKMIKGLNRKIQIKYNRGGEIKTEMVPRYTMLTNHCGRRTLITTLVNLGCDYKDIMVVSSHVTLKSFETYIKKNKEGAVKSMLKQYQQRVTNQLPNSTANTL